LPSLRAQRSNPACGAKKEAGLPRRCAPRTDVLNFRNTSHGNRIHRPG
jgi:hypothetical protein